VQEDSFSSAALGSEKQELIMMDKGIIKSEREKNLKGQLKDAVDQSCEFSVRYAARMKMYKLIIKLSGEE
jgi:hypothetical protein